MLIYQSTITKITGMFTSFSEIVHLDTHLYML